MKTQKKTEPQNQALLDQVVADILLDARHEPQAYLNDCLVPEGGE